MLGVTEGHLVFRCISALCSNKSDTIVDFIFNMLTFLELLKKLPHSRLDISGL